MNRRLNGCCLVVSQIDIGCHHRARPVEQATGFGQIADRNLKCLGIARQGSHFRIAFVEAGIGKLGQPGQRLDRQHTRYLSHVLAELIDIVQHLEIVAGIVWCLKNHSQHVHANVKALDDVFNVLVVTRVRAQLRRSRLQRTNVAPMALPDGQAEQHEGSSQDQPGMIDVGDKAQALNQQTTLELYPLQMQGVLA